MSQIYASVSSTPSVSTSFTTDDGTAVPVGNNINILARDTTDNNVNGIQTVADPNGGDDVFIELTNRLENRDTVTGATTVDIITFDLGATAAVYKFWFYLSGRETTSGDGYGFSYEALARTDGASATIIDKNDIIDDADASLTAMEAEALVSGNNLIIRVTGAAGETVALSIVGLYVRA